MIRSIQTRSAADVARELGISLGSARNCPRPTGLQSSVCTLGAKESHRWLQSSLYGSVWAFLVSFGNITLIKESSFGAEILLLYKTWNQKKDVWQRNYHLPPAKKMEALSSPKMTMENCLGTIKMCMFWISLIIVTLCAECYCSTLSLWWPFFAKGLFLCQSIVLLHENARHHTPNWTYSCLWQYVW